MGLRDMGALESALLRPQMGYYDGLIEEAAAMMEQAGAIRTEVERLLADVTRLGDRVQRLEGHFDQAGRDIREIRISADKISKRGLRLTDLELEEVAAELPEPTGRPRLVEKTPAE